MALRNGRGGASAPRPPDLRSGGAIGGRAGGTPGVILRGIAWKGGAGECERLAAYLAPGPGRHLDATERARLLRELPIVERAECSLRPGGGASCALTPKRLVQRVKIEGKIPFALLEADLRRRLFLRPATALQAPLHAQARRARMSVPFDDDDRCKVTDRILEVMGGARLV